MFVALMGGREAASKRKGSVSFDIRKIQGGQTLSANKQHVFFLSPNEKRG